jgi:23S rRNA (adenine-N6)-dimethyltransferase
VVAARSPRPAGRHHLKPAEARRLVERAGVRPGDLVVDLGAGHGALTAPLVAAGARVLAVELDRRSARVLRDRFGDEPAVTVVEEDLLTVRLPGRPFRVVANLPFATTSGAMRRLLHPRSGLLRADVVLQRSAARRWAGAGGRAFAVHVDSNLDRRAFEPPPNVDAAVLVARRVGGRRP